MSVPGSKGGHSKHSLGVLDIGSNTIRFVVYSGEGRAAVPMFSERFACGLGRSLARSREMDPDAVVETLKVLNRWGNLARKMSLTGVHAVATAAVRETVDSKDFITRASKALGQRIKVVTGDEEARLAAMGVLFGIPDAEGVVADLGGGSLELAQVSEGRILKTVTLPLGSLRLYDQSGNDPKKAAKIIKQAFGKVDWLRSISSGHSLYLVGGLWRNLLWAHMGLAGHPLEVLHCYEISGDEARTMPKLLRKTGEEGVKALGKVAADRIPYLLMGAQLLKRIAARIKAGRVVVSGYGLREGLLMDRMPRKVRDADPLLAGAADMCQRFGCSLKYGMELVEWTGVLFGENGIGESRAQKRLRVAGCLLGEIVHHTHPDHRADVMLQEILYSHLTGISHRERVFLAHIGFHRHNGPDSNDLARRTAAMLDNGSRGRAMAIGMALRLAHAVGANVPGMAIRTRLYRHGDMLELRVPPPLEFIEGPMVGKCLGRLAQSLGLQPQVVVE